MCLRVFRFLERIGTENPHEIWISGQPVTSNLPTGQKPRSQYQLIPYNRIEDHFADQMQIPISAGSIHNFNRDAFDRLVIFETWVKDQLAASDLIHADETGCQYRRKTELAAHHFK